MTAHTAHDAVCMLLRAAEEVDIQIPVKAMDATEKTTASQPMEQNTASQPMVDTTASQPMEEISESTAIVDMAPTQGQADQELSRKRLAPDEPTDGAGHADICPVSADSITTNESVQGPSQKKPKTAPKPRSERHIALNAEGLGRAREAMPEYALLAQQKKEEFLKLKPDAAPPPLTGLKNTDAGNLAKYAWYLLQCLHLTNVIEIFPPKEGEESFGGISKIEIESSKLEQFNKNPHFHVKLNPGHGGLSKKDIDRMNKTTQIRLKRIGMLGFLRGDSKTGNAALENVGYRASDGAWVLTYSHATWEQAQKAHAAYRSTRVQKQASNGKVQRPSVVSHDKAVQYTSDVPQDQPQVQPVIPQIEQQVQPSIPQVELQVQPVVSQVLPVLPQAQSAGAQQHPEASSVASAVQAELDKALQNSPMVPVNMKEFAEDIARRVVAMLHSGQQSNSLT